MSARHIHLVRRLTIAELSQAEFSLGKPTSCVRLRDERAGVFSFVTGLYERIDQLPEEVRALLPWHLLDAQRTDAQLDPHWGELSGQIELDREGFGKILRVIAPIYAAAVVALPGPVGAERPRRSGDIVRDIQNIVTGSGTYTPVVGMRELHLYARGPGGDGAARLLSTGNGRGAGGGGGFTYAKKTGADVKPYAYVVGTSVGTDTTIAGMTAGSGVTGSTTSGGAGGAATGGDTNEAGGAGGNATTDGTTPTNGNPGGAQGADSVETGGGGGGGGGGLSGFPKSGAGGRGGVANAVGGVTGEGNNNGFNIDATGKGNGGGGGGGGSTFTGSPGSGSGGEIWAEALG